MNALTSELRDLRAQLEEAAAAHAQEVKRLREQAGDMGRQRESCLREVSRLPACSPLCAAQLRPLGAQKVPLRVRERRKGGRQQTFIKGLLCTCGA